MRELLRKIDLPFALIFLGLLFFGLIMLSSASGPIGFERFGDSFYFIKHQLLQGLLPGALAFFIGFTIPYKTWKRYAFPMLLLSIILLILVYIPGIGTDFGTFARSWVSVGAFSFQPSEIVKLTFLFYLAAWMEKQGGGLKSFQDGLVPFLVILAFVGGLIFFQPDLGTLSIILAMSLVVFFVAGGSVAHLIGLGAVGLVFFGLAIRLSPYRAARLMTFLHPELDPQGIGYQINQALLAVGSGGLFGRGYGHSLQKFQYLPEVIGDSIFAVLAEELGFIFTAAFIILFLVFVLRGIRIGHLAKDAFGKYVAIGVMTWFGVQAFVNIGAMLGILPLTGVPLPFLSYGGTSLIISMMAVGVVLNISRSSNGYA